MNSRAGLPAYTHRVGGRLIAPGACAPASVAVVDFQSLYPSMIIAYNLCFSTCVGRINPGLAKEGTAQTRGRL
eukprot:21992-Eustigmatos_ZCMA.PRE.1